MMTRMHGGLSNDRTLVLGGDGNAIHELAELLREPRAGGIRLDPPAERPALDPVRRLIVTVAPHAARATVIDGVATVTGSADELTRLADETEEFVEYNDLSRPGMHMHLVDAAPSDGGADVVIVGGVPG